MPSPIGQLKPLDATGRGQEAVLGVFGVQASLDGVPVQVHVGLPEPQRLARCDAELVGDEIAPGHELRDGVLHLQARVHLEEGEGAAVVQQELARPCAHIADGASECQGGLAHPCAQVRIHGR